MRTLLVLTGLTAGLLSPLAPGVAAQAAGETCDGLPATLVGTPGSTVTGTDGADVIVSNGAAKVDGKGGDDVICTTASVAPPPDPSGQSNWVIVLGGPGNDLIDRRGETDPAASGGLYGDAGQDTIFGSPASEYVGIGDGERDVVQTYGGADRVVEAFVRGGPADPDVVDLGAGDDTFSSAFPFSPNLAVAGGDGVDSMSLQLTAGDWTIDAAAGSLAEGDTRAFTFSSFEAFETSHRTSRKPAGSLTFRGTGSGESLLSDAARLSADTAGGDDRVQVVAGWTIRVHIDAGPGHDQLNASTSDRDPLSLDLRHGRLRTGYAGVALRGSVTRFEDATVTGGVVQLVGTARDNVLELTSCRRATLRAGAGDDQILLKRRPRPLCHPGTAPAAYAGSGNDVVVGSRVDDVIVGGRGRDRADGGRGRDTCVSVEVRKSCERR
jgi:RTX calcium-binding nonapeptide repeat (4 copies)